MDAQVQRDTQPPREPTQEEHRAMVDLGNKALGDVRRALDTTMDLARDVGGIGGIYWIAQVIAHAMTVGCGMAVQAMRDGAESLGKPSDGLNHAKIRMDDVLFAAMVSVAMEEARANRVDDVPAPDLGDVLDRAQMLFERVRGRPHTLPKSMVA